MSIRNVTILNVSLSDADRGFLNATITLDYGDGTHQALPIVPLYVPRTGLESISFAGHFIWRCMQVTGTPKWEKIPGRTIRVDVEDGKILSQKVLKTNAEDR